MSVKIFKFNSGEEVIADVVSEPLVGSSTTGSTYVIKNPLRIIVRPTGDGNFAPAFTPWIAAYSSRTELTVSANSTIVAPFDAPSQFEQAYLEETSGIAVVTNESGIIS